MAAFWGDTSALARLLAKLLISTPEPDPKDVIRDCAAALAAALPVLIALAELVVAVVAVLVVDEETLVTMV